MKQFHLSAVIDLPDDTFEAAELLSKIKVPWYAALQNLKDAGVKFEHKNEVLETRAKPAPGAKRGRKPKAANGTSALELELPAS